MHLFNYSMNENEFLQCECLDIDMTLGINEPMKVTSYLPRLQGHQPLSPWRETPKCIAPDCRGRHTLRHFDIKIKWK